METRISEVFSSIQGEGIFVGVRQIFVRFFGCNLNCAYCDTQDLQRDRDDFCQVQIQPGKPDFIRCRNPVSVSQLLQIVKKFELQKHHSLSLTGGEPLLNWKFLQEFLPGLDSLCPVYLETNGTLWSELEEVLRWINMISMDIKLPSACGKSFWWEHEKFLLTAREKEVFVKVVMTGETTVDEIKSVVDLIENIDSRIPLVLQPVTPYGGMTAPAPEKVIAMQDYCAVRLKNVRVIPQTHKIIDQL